MTSASNSDQLTASGFPFPRSRYAVFFCLAVAGVVVDLATKSWIFGLLLPRGWGHVQWIWPGHVGLELSLNRGALFGIGQGWVPLFVVLSVLAACGIIYWLFVSGEARSLWLTVALGGIMAGIFGNLYDRLGLHGLEDGEGAQIYAVRDWILLQWNDVYRWPNFNVADSLLVCGAIILFLHAFSRPDDKKPDDSGKTTRPST
jgi:signal peptidase II